MRIIAGSFVLSLNKGVFPFPVPRRGRAGLGDPHVEPPGTGEGVTGGFADPRVHHPGRPSPRLILIVRGRDYTGPI